MIKKDIQKEFEGLKIRIKFYKISPYMKRRYKPEFWQPEAWIYTSLSGKLGYCITEEDYNNIEYRNNFFDMIKAEAKNN
jgi:hypothetical protein